MTYNPTHLTVPVGATPVPYDSWDAHRAAISHDVACRRAATERRLRLASAEV